MSDAAPPPLTAEEIDEGEPEPTLTQRVWEALARIRVSRDLAGQPADTRWRLLIDAWDECVQRWGAESGPAKGALLDLVREAWDDDEATATPDGDRLRWRVRVDDDDGRRDVDPHVLQGATELAALVAALEATPGVEP